MRTTILALTLFTIALLAAPAGAQLTLTPNPDTLTIPPGGGTVMWDAQIVSPFPGVIMTDLWTIVDFPTGGSFDPFMIVQEIPFNQNLVVTIENAIFNVPSFAPPGEYLFTMHVGQYPNQIYDQESYTFTKLAGGDQDVAVCGTWTGSWTPVVR